MVHTAYLVGCVEHLLEAHYVQHESTYSTINILDSNAFVSKTMFSYAVLSTFGLTFFMYT